jgi:hypothetical protein
MPSISQISDEDSYVEQTELGMVDYRSERRGNAAQLVVGRGPRQAVRRPRRSATGVSIAALASAQHHCLQASPVTLNCYVAIYKNSNWESLVVSLSHIPTILA